MRNLERAVTELLRKCAKRIAAGEVETLSVSDKTWKRFGMSTRFMKRLRRIRLKLEFDVAVVGGGPAGMMAAASAAKLGAGRCCWKRTRSWAES